jgi:hypothetical protein
MEHANKCIILKKYVYWNTMHGIMNQIATLITILSEQK